MRGKTTHIVATTGNRSYGFLFIYKKNFIYICVCVYTNLELYYSTIKMNYNADLQNVKTITFEHCKKQTNTTWTTCCIRVPFPQEGLFQPHRMGRTTNTTQPKEKVLCP